jgi:hypothetical protein
VDRNQGTGGSAEEVLIPPRAPGPVPRDAAEYRTSHQARSAPIIEIEQTADQLAGRVEAADRPVVGVEHFTVSGYAQAPEREGDAAGHRIGLVGRCASSVFAHGTRRRGVGRLLLVRVGVRP